MRGLLLALLLLASPLAGADDSAQLLQRGDYAKLLKAHAGKPFIVALWSTSCTHCPVDLAIFERLAAHHAELDLVLIATDTPDDLPAIHQVLQRYHLEGKSAARAARVESWVFADSYAERQRYEVDPQWYGELPRTYFFDSNGKAQAISGELDERQVLAWLRQVR